LVIFYLAFSPVKSEYRNVTWYSKSKQNLNVIERLQIFIELTIKYHQENTFNPNVSNNNDSKKNDTDKLVERSAHIVILSKVIKKTPKIVPYWNGETYLPLFTSFIPRIVWSDKPVQTIGNEFGRRYKFLDKTDFSTSINLPIIIEMYINFGRWGIIIGMPLLGVFLAFLEQKLNNLRMNSIEFVVGASAAFQLTYQEISLAISVGTLIPFLVSIYIAFRFLLNKKTEIVS
ncbi:MAG: hypothetical protein C6Y22_29500, partial [Hapalosiphonaceae cyanobacterium JJU2]